MKNIVRTVSIFALVSSLFFGCSNAVTHIDETNYIGSRAVVSDAARTATITIYVFNADPQKKWNVWAWREEGAVDSNYNDPANWPGGDIVLTADKEFLALSTTMTVDPTYEMGILFVTSTGDSQTKDILIPKENLVDGSKLYFVYGETAYYTEASDCTGLRNALLQSSDGKEISAHILGYKEEDVTKDKISVSDKDGKPLIVNKVSFNVDKSEANITLTDGAISKLPYTISFAGVKKSVSFPASMIDELGYVYDGDDLGVTLDGSKAYFKVWAPLATEVSLLLYDDVSKVGNFKSATVAAHSSGSTDEIELRGTPACEPVAMKKNEDTGVWSYELSDYSAYKYYKYQIVNNGETYYVCDIWAKSASPDSIAAQIVDINAGTMYGAKESYVNPFGKSGAENKSYSDAIIYEMHIRDWSKAFGGDGKFIDLAQSQEFIDHLKDIGITHVQIVPMFDYAQVNSDEKYNWGYNPYHYNVPEGRYVKDMKDGTDAVNQLRQFIEVLHDAGIAINMDVVYNHTSGTQGGSLYDSTVPEYFYRMDSAGSYSNGSGCGNEIATNHKMVKKYVIESLKHWMLDYHINGFRFDLMGCQEKSTMKEIYDELYKIDPNVMVYGEPWTGGTAAVTDGAIQAVKGTTGLGAGAFDDDFRDAIKGAEFGGFKHGQVQGTFADEGIVIGLKGLVGSNKRNETGIPALSLHYVECHDNYTLFDKLAMSYLGKTTYSGDLFAAIGADGLAAVKAQDKLAAAYVLLSQGTAFLNGGQEFLRTKRGDENSYQSDDTINAIDISFKKKYADVFATYKGLIALRKDYSAFRNAKTAEASVISKGVTLYEVTADDGNFTVVFNATDAQASFDAVKGKVVNIEEKLNVSGSYFGLGFNDVSVNVQKYSIDDTETTVSTVPAKSFVILKK